jgi:hypothetical protein
MKEVVNDFYVFYEAEEAEKAVETMRRAIGKKNEVDAAFRFARSMLKLTGERESFKDEGIQSRLALLNTYSKILAVKNEVQEAAEFAANLATKVYREYTNIGGDHYEVTAYWNGTTREEERDKALNKLYKPGVNTKTRNPE